jgi:hypothetical protein
MNCQRDDLTEEFDLCATIPKGLPKAVRDDELVFGHFWIPISERVHGRSLHNRG